MIKSIKVDWIHWIKKELVFGKQSKIVWQSLLWKTTILNCIMACYSWYFPWYTNTIPKWSIELKTDSWDIVISNSKVIWNVYDSDIIRYIVPWNFFRLNPTTPKQREVIAKILDIDMINFEKINIDLKNYQVELRDFNIRKEQITDDIIRLEWQATALDWILEKPKKIELIKDNSVEIQEAYEKYIEWLQEENKKIEEWNNKLSSEFNNKIEAINKYRATERIELEIKHKNLSEELIEITDKAEEIWEVTSGTIKCRECWTVIKVEDKKQLMNELRTKYKICYDQKEHIKKELLEIQNYIDWETLKIFKPEMRSLHTIYFQQSLTYKSSVTWIKYKEVDNSEYEQYLKDLSAYNESEARRVVILDEIKIKEKQLKELNFIELESKINNLLEEKKKFNKHLDTKVKETWLDIRLFKIQKNWIEKETFEIYDSEWNMYWETSHWNELYIELLIAKLFVNYLKLDFILIDKFESIWINLRDKILEECKDLQIIATEVTKETEIKVKNI